MDVNIKLNKSFTQNFNKLINEYGETLAQLNGLSEEQLSLTDFLDTFVKTDTVADASIDGNANVGTKDVCSLLAEIDKPHLKLLAFNKIFMEMAQKYGYQDAVKWMDGEWTGKFYLHDFNSTSLKPYCYNYDLDKLANEGMFFVNNFNSQPAKHLTTFVDFVIEFVSWTSNRSSGAAGIASYLINAYYFWMNDVKNGYYVKSPEYYRDQEFQRFV